MGEGEPKSSNAMEPEKAAPQLVDSAAELAAIGPQDNQNAKKKPEPEPEPIDPRVEHMNKLAGIRKLPIHYETEPDPGSTRDIDAASPETQKICEGMPCHYVVYCYSRPAEVRPFAIFYSYL